MLQASCLTAAMRRKLPSGWVYLALVKTVEGYLKTWEKELDEYSLCWYGKTVSLCRIILSYCVCDCHCCLWNHCALLALVLKRASYLTQCTFNSEPEVFCKCKRYRKYRARADNCTCRTFSMFMCALVRLFLLPSRISVFPCVFLSVYFFIQSDGTFSSR